MYYFHVTKAFRIFNGGKRDGTGFQPAEPSTLAFQGEEYVVVADSSEAKVYNRRTGTLLGAYFSAFALSPASVPRRNGAYEFAVRKDVFDEHELIFR
jgi:hypothetical protein